MVQETEDKVQLTQNSKAIIAETSNYNYDTIPNGSYSYDYYDVSPETAVNSLAAGSTTEAIFEIPDYAHNLAQSVIEMDLLFTAEAATTSLHSGVCSVIDSIRIDGDQPGQPLLELNDVPYYSKMTWPYATSNDEFNSNRVQYPAATLAAVKNKGHIFHRVGTNVDPIADNKAVNSLVNQTHYIDEGGIVVGANEATNGINVRYQSLVNGAVAIKLSIPMSSFKHTLLNLNKDIYWGQALRLTFNLSSLEAVGWEHTSTTTQTGGAALDAGCAVSNLKYRVARCDRMVNEALKARFLNQGFQFFIPECTVRKTAISSAGNQLIDRKVPATSGTSLLRIYSSVMHGTQTLAGRYNNYNGDQERVTFVRTYINGRPLQYKNMLPVNSDPYTRLYKKIKDSPIGFNNRQFDALFTWCDDLSGIQSFSLCDKYDFDNAGLALNETITHTFEFSSVLAAASLYQVYVTQKVLRITPQGTFISLNS